MVLVGLTVILDLGLTFDVLVFWLRLLYCFGFFYGY